MERPNLIQFIDVSKQYSPRKTYALYHTNFNVDAGEFIFLIGESGAGKSTLIKLLTCEETPTEGTIILDNFQVSRMRKKFVPYLRRKIGLIYQDFKLIPSKTVFENVAFAAEIVGAPRAAIDQRVPYLLRAVGLGNRMHSYPGELSGGEAQRVGVARAMINSPRLILADEPTGNLDRNNGEAIMALLAEINLRGTTVIACTHDLAMVERMNKRVIELQKGRIIRDMAPLPQPVIQQTTCYLPADGADRNFSEFAPDLAIQERADRDLADLMREAEIPDWDQVKARITADSERRRLLRRHHDKKGKEAGEEAQHGQ